MYLWAFLMKPYDLLSPLAVDPYDCPFHTIILHFAGQFKVHTYANIYLYIAVSDGYLKRIVGFKMYTQATCRNYRCAQTNRGMLRLDKTIRALLDSLNFLSMLSTRFWLSFVSFKVIHTMHTKIYFVILILYFCEF